MYICVVIKDSKCVWVFTEEERINKQQTESLYLQKQLEANYVRLEFIIQMNRS
jgi:hypothetical protein